MRGGRDSSTVPGRRSRSIPGTRGYLRAGVTLRLMDNSSTDLHWVKSRRSFSNGNCLEVAWHRAAGMVHVRDSKHPDGPQLLFTLAEWQAFAGGVRDGDFDNLVSA